MKVKVKLSRISPLIIERYQDEKEAFCNYFDAIGVECFEPICPFCGKELENSKCCCKEYDQAYKKLCLESYSKTQIHSKVYDIRISNLISVKTNQINMYEVETGSIDASFFDYGSIASGFLIGNWFVSNGTYEDDTLTFYVRKEGKNQIYKCEVKYSIEVSKYSKVTFYEIKRHFNSRGCNSKILGNYNIQYKDITIDTISYDEFLTRLKSNL